MFKNKRYLLYIIALIIIGLVILIPVVWGGLTFAAAPKTKIALIEAPAGSTPTATAFQPLASTETYIPTNYPTPTPTATPTPIKIKPSSHDSGADPIPQPDHQINIMILGSDQKYKGFIGRTDVIILLTINTKDQTVNVTSFPRDLYVYIPGWTDQRLNTAFAHGGFKTFQKTLTHNFGFEPDYYVLINLWAFEHIVNDLGGINVYVPRTVCDEKWVGGLTHCVYPGNYHFYGREALWYVRSRETTNDFDRNYRQQLVLEAIFKRLFSLNSITKIPKLFNTYVNNVTTNLDLSTIVSLTATGLKLTDSSRINQYFINQRAVHSWISPSGAQVLLPNFNAIRGILKDALNSP